MSPLQSGLEDAISISLSRRCQKLVKWTDNTKCLISLSCTVSGKYHPIGIAKSGRISQVESLDIWWGNDILVTRVGMSDVYNRGKVHHPIGVGWKFDLRQDSCPIWFRTVGLNGLKPMNETSETRTFFLFSVAIQPTRIVERNEQFERS